jgi:non-ribosomal peptide synthetase component F
MLFLAAYKVLLMRYCGQEDIIVGTPIANRSQPEMAGVIGFCVNLLALRTDLAGNPSFREVLRRERETCLGGYSHQELPFRMLVQDLTPARTIGQSPLFQVQFALHEAQNYSLQLPGLRLSSLFDAGKLSDDMVSLVARSQPATDHMFLNIADSGSTLGAYLHYRSDLFSDASIRRLPRMGCSADVARRTDATARRVEQDRPSDCRAGLHRQIIRGARGGIS